MVTVIVATSGRSTLARTVQSIECWPGDEVIVMGAVEDRIDGPVRYVKCKAGHDWGHAERNRAMTMAQGQYLAFMDDDDVQVSGARLAIAEAIDDAPGRPMVFKMRFPDGRVLWQEPILKHGNVGTPMFVIPNVPAKLGRWGERNYSGDWAFARSLKWPAADFVWRTNVIADLRPAA